VGTPDDGRKDFKLDADLWQQLKDIIDDIRDAKDPEPIGQPPSC
jgi:hypothetical protein